MNLLNSIVAMLDLSNLRIKKKDRKPSVVKDIIDQPDAYKLEAFVEGDEVVIKIRRRDKEGS